VAQVSIKAENRSDFGKGAARRCRRAGLVPAVLYGKGTEPRHVALPDHELTLALRHPGLVLEVELDGTTQLAAPRDVQRDPVRRVIEHIDLVLVSKSEAAELVEAGLAAEAAAEAAHAAEAEALKYATAADDLDVEAHLGDEAEAGEEPVAEADSEA
jgi:large subunit ribosomal protein L25